MQAGGRRVHADTEARASGCGKPETIDVPAHQRRKHRTGDEVNDSGLRFGTDVPVREIVLPCPELCGPDADQLSQSVRTDRRQGELAAGAPAGQPCGAQVPAPGGASQVSGQTPTSIDRLTRGLNEAGLQRSALPTAVG